MSAAGFHESGSFKLSRERRRRGDRGDCCALRLAGRQQGQGQSHPSGVMWIPHQLRYEQRRQGSTTLYRGSSRGR